MENNKTAKKVFTGEVVSDKMNKTIVVKVPRWSKHQQFHKTVRMINKYKVHDENNSAKIGDTVEFYEGRPLSKTKFMYLARVIKSHAVNE